MNNVSVGFTFVTTFIEVIKTFYGGLYNNSAIKKDE